MGFSAASAGELVSAGVLNDCSPSVNEGTIPLVLGCKFAAADALTGKANPVDCIAPSCKVAATGCNAADTTGWLKCSDAGHKLTAGV